MALKSDQSQYCTKVKQQITSDLDLGSVNIYIPKEKQLSVALYWYSVDIDQALEPFI